MTLIDLLATVGVIGILAGSAAAGAASGADRTRVVLLQGEVATAFRAAQAAARDLSAPVLVRVSAESLIVRRVGSDSLLLDARPGPGEAGVAITPAFHETVFEAGGLARGSANVTIRLSRGGIERRITLSRLGRLRTN
ncbi:MAG: hypothetical protein AB7L66_16585 [Gemmatimonadales bacterium]